MGQKCSCLKGIGFGRLNGARRRRLSEDNASAESVPYVKSTFISELNARAVTDILESYNQPSNKILGSVAPVVKPDDVLKQKSRQPTPAPEFEIKNGTLILIPHKRDDSDATDFVPGDQFEIRTTRFESHQKHSEEFPDQAYVSSKPKLVFLDNDNDSKKQPEEESKVSAIPSKPPNQHKIVFAPSVTDWSNIDENNPECLSKLPLLSGGVESGHQQELDYGTPSAPSIPKRQNEIVLIPSNIDSSNINEKDKESLSKLPFLCSDSKSGRQSVLCSLAPSVPQHSISDMSKPSIPKRQNEIVLIPSNIDSSNKSEKDTESLSKLPFLCSDSKSGSQSLLCSLASSVPQHSISDMSKPSIPKRQNEIVLIPSDIDSSNTNEKDTESLSKLPFLCSDSKSGSQSVLCSSAPSVPQHSISDMPKLDGLKPISLPEQALLDSNTNDKNQQNLDCAAFSAPNISPRHYSKGILDVPDISSFKCDPEYFHLETCPPETPPPNYEHYV